MCEEKQQKEYDNIWERYLLYSLYLTWNGVDVNIHRLSFIHSQFKGIGFIFTKRYVIQFVSDLWQVDGFHRVLWFPLPIKLTYKVEQGDTHSINLLFVTGSVKSDFSSIAIHWKEVFCTLVVQVSQCSICLTVYYGCTNETVYYWDMLTCL
jgi:sensor histidine kinase YesM